MPPRAAKSRKKSAPNLLSGSARIYCLSSPPPFPPEGGPCAPVYLPWNGPTPGLRNPLSSGFSSIEAVTTSISGKSTLRVINHKREKIKFGSELGVVGANEPFNASHCGYHGGQCFPC